MKVQENDGKRSSCRGGGYDLSERGALIPAFVRQRFVNDETASPRV